MGEVFWNKPVSYRDAEYSAIKPIFYIVILRRDEMLFENQQNSTIFLKYIFSILINQKIFFQDP